MSIYISGSLAFDRIMTFNGLFEDHIMPDKLHILNVSFLIDHMEEKRGGTAGNIAYTLALFGQKPIILSSVGKDFSDYGKVLKNMGLSDEGIRYIKDEYTAHCVITTDMADNQIIAFCPAAMKYPCNYKFEHLNPSEDIAIVSPGNIQDMHTLPLIYKKQGIKYIYDPSQQLTALSSEQILDGINGSYILISNDYEMEMITQITGRCKHDLLKLTKYIITTLGDQGCFLTTAEEEIHIPAMRTEAVDPTGAGDALRGGLLYGLHKKIPILQSLQMGIIAASFCVEKYGTQAHVFNMESFSMRHEKVFKGL